VKKNMPCKLIVANEDSMDTTIIIPSIALIEGKIHGPTYSESPLFPGYLTMEQSVEQIKKRRIDALLEFLQEWDFSVEWDGKTVAESDLSLDEPSWFHARMRTDGCVAEALELAKEMEVPIALHIDGSYDCNFHDPDGNRSSICWYDPDSRKYHESGAPAESIEPVITYEDFAAALTCGDPGASLSKYKALETLGILTSGDK